MVVISVQTIQWLLIGCASICAFMIGRAVALKKNDDLIETTIMYMVENKLVRWKRDENGEIEILPLEDK